MAVPRGGQFGMISGAQSHAGINNKPSQNAIIKTPATSTGQSRTPRPQNAQVAVPANPQEPMGGGYQAEPIIANPGPLDGLPTLPTVSQWDMVAWPIFPCHQEGSCLSNDAANGQSWERIVSDCGCDDVSDMEKPFPPINYGDVPVYLPDCGIPPGQALTPLDNYELGQCCDRHELGPCKYIYRLNSGIFDGIKQGASGRGLLNSDKKKREIMAAALDCSKKRHSGKDQRLYRKGDQARFLCDDAKTFLKSGPCHDSNGAVVISNATCNCHGGSHDWNTNDGKKYWVNDAQRFDPSGKTRPHNLSPPGNPTWDITDRRSFDGPWGMYAKKDLWTCEQVRNPDNWHIFIRDDFSWIWNAGDNAFNRLLKCIALNAAEVEMQAPANASPSGHITSPPLPPADKNWPIKQTGKDPMGSWHFEFENAADGTEETFYYIEIIRVRQDADEDGNILVMVDWKWGSSTADSPCHIEEDPALITWHGPYWWTYRYDNGDTDHGVGSWGDKDLLLKPEMHHSLNNNLKIVFTELQSWLGQGKGNNPAMNGIYGPWWFTPKCWGRWHADTLNEYRCKPVKASNGLMSPYCECYKDLRVTHGTLGGFSGRSLGGGCALYNCLYKDFPTNANSCNMTDAGWTAVSKLAGTTKCTDCVCLDQLQGKSDCGANPQGLNDPDDPFVIPKPQPTWRPSPKTEDWGVPDPDESLPDDFDPFADTTPPPCLNEVRGEAYVSGADPILFPCIKVEWDHPTSMDHSHVHWTIAESLDDLSFLFDNYSALGNSILQGTNFREICDATRVTDSDADNKGFKYYNGSPDGVAGYLKWDHMYHIMLWPCDSTNNCRDCGNSAGQPLFGSWLTVTTPSDPNA